MSKFFKYFVKRYPGFKEKVLKGEYKEALSIYADAYLELGEGKKKWDDYWRVYSAAYDGLHRHNSTRERDLRELVGDDKAFDGFMEYFRTHYGQGGICRVSNKLSKEVKADKKVEKCLRKRQLIAFIKLNIKKGILDKKKLYEEAKQYIQEFIISRRLEIFKEYMKNLLNLEPEIKMFMSVLQEFGRDYNLLLNYQWKYDNVENSAQHAVEDFLYWQAARYINRKGTGRNIPTNALTANLKANPLLFDLVEDKRDRKVLLRSFRYQKRATYTEAMNYRLINAAVHRLDNDDTLERIQTSKVVAGPKTLNEFKDLKNAKNKYLRNIIDYYWRARPVIDFLDERLANAMIEVVSTPRLERLLPEQRKFLDSLPTADASTKEQCVKVFNRIIGIYTFSTRVKNISRRDYYDYYESLMVRDKNKKERKWVKPLGASLDVYEPRLKKYSQDEYEYVQTDEGYTLARYDCSGNLCMGAEKGNYVKKVFYNKY